jgi:poly(A) polymerase
MIKKFIDKLLGKSAGGAQGKSRFGKRQEVPAEVHKIDPALVDERAKNVVTTLQQAGYEAYVVGGAVRDLLLGLRPKDFDVATNATPEQVKSLSGAPSSSAGAFASCTSCTAGAASTR